MSRRSQLHGQPDRVVAATPYLRLIDRDGWFFVERPNSNGVVTIVALTEERNLILVEQFRPAVLKNVIEFPSGLIGDEAGARDESVLSAAHRELLEETGYKAAAMEIVATSPTSSGLTNEMVTFVRASGLTRVSAGGGVGNENIRTHEVPLTDILPWLRQKESDGLLVAAKIYAGLFFAGR